jgi:hypothetical protein
VAPDQLVRHVLGDLGEVARLALFEQQRQEMHLEQHIAQLVDQL